MHPVFLRENCRDKLLGAGLSHAACDSDHLYRKLGSVKFRDLPQRFQTVLHKDAGTCGLFRQLLAYHAKRSFCEHVRNETVAIHPLPLHRDENAVLFRLSGIDYHGGSFPARQLSPAHQLPSAGRCQIFERHVFHCNLSFIFNRGVQASESIHTNPQSPRPSPALPAESGRWASCRAAYSLPGSIHCRPFPS